MKILIIEDDEVLLEQLKNKLKKANYQVDSSSSGEEGLYRAQEYPYDLAIVDIGLPRMSGIEVIQKLRQENYNKPILILTARSSWQDKVYGLKAGADDYLVKPFQFEELNARIEALLRRSGGYSNSKLSQGPYVLDMETQEVRANDTSITLTAFEYKLIQYFMLNPNKVTSKSTLSDYLYEEDIDRDSNVIEVLVARIRQKLDPDNTHKPIETLRGRGYRFKSF
ncbi:DNA-binding response regulator [Gammaproteobacteria bacterium 45_16_T64]|nr:DNA-binding response regulator [Gammaproteobacteria bacterium 45_16_T64]